MLIERKLLITKPLLARRVDSETNKKVFVKEPSNDGGWLIRAHIERWNWAFLEARDSLGFTDVSVQSITVARSFYLPKKDLHCLEIRRENFECVMDGDFVIQRFNLAKTPPPHSNASRFSRSPELEEFDKMLHFIGDILGISESKNDLQYGTFKILNE